MLVQTSLFKPIAKTQLYDDHEEVKDIKCKYFMLLYETNR